MYPWEYGNAHVTSIKWSEYQLTLFGGLVEFLQLEVTWDDITEASCYVPGPSIAHSVTGPSDLSDKCPSWITGPGSPS